MPVLVELAVVRQVDLRHDAEQPAALDGDGRVVDAPGVAERRADEQERPQRGGAFDQPERSRAPPRRAARPAAGGRRSRSRRAPVREKPRPTRPARRIVPRRAGWPPHWPPGRRWRSAWCRRRHGRSRAGRWTGSSWREWAQTARCVQVGAARHRPLVGRSGTSVPTCPDRSEPAGVVRRESNRTNAEGQGRGWERDRTNRRPSRRGATGRVRRWSAGAPACHRTNAGGGEGRGWERHRTNRRPSRGRGATGRVRRWLADAPACHRTNAEGVAALGLRGAWRVLAG